MSDLHPNLNVPEWAAPLTLQQFADFRGALEDYFKNWDIPVEVKDGFVLTGREFFGHRRFGLGNLRQICAQMPNERYLAIVTGHFDALVSAYKFEKEFDANSADFEKIREFIGARLYHRDSIGMVGEAAVLGQHIGESVVEVLVFDLPQSVRNVQAKFLDTWGKSRETLFALGRQNIRAKYATDLKPIAVEDMEFHFAQGDHFFVPNIVLHLEEYPHLIGTHGTLLAMPHRHTTMLYPIENDQLMAMMHRLIPAAHGMNSEGPGAVSPHLYWYSKGVFHEITIEQVDQQLSVTPPPEFVELLNELAT